MVSMMPLQMERGCPLRLEALGTTTERDNEIVTDGTVLAVTLGAFDLVIEGTLLHIGLGSIKLGTLDVMIGKSRQTRHGRC